ISNYTPAHITFTIFAKVIACSPDKQMFAYCSCTVTPNGLVTLSAKNDLTSNTLTPAVPNTIVIKLLATVPTAGRCTNTAATPTAGNLVRGMVAWGSTIHALTVAGSPTTYYGVESAFVPAELSAGELARLH